MLSFRDEGFPFRVFRKGPTEHTEMITRTSSLNFFGKNSKRRAAFDIYFTGRDGQRRASAFKASVFDRHPVPSTKWF
jgi:hypothetical protein